MERCRNCSSPLQGPFCHHCGQDHRHYIRELWSLIPEFLGEFSNWDGRLWRTLIPLWVRPGWLTLRYVAGHRAPYVPPLRLYIFTSIVAFLVLSAITQPPAPPPSFEEATFTEPPKLELAFVSEALEARLMERIAELSASPERLLDALFSVAPQVMFLLLPLFALWLKVVYLGRGHFYMEHMLLALHTHSLVLQVIIVLALLSWLGNVLTWSPLDAVFGWFSVLLFLWVPLYLFLSQKQYYRQGWFVTSIRFTLVALGYLAMLMVAGVALLVYSLLNA